MKLFVPAVGYRIVLTSDWQFDLYYESRNKTLLEQRGIVFDWHSCYEDPKPGDPPWPRALKCLSTSVPKGTLMEVDRVYVRTASKSATSKDEDYDSLTFRIIDPKTGKGSVRFWAKLADVNNIEYELPSNFTAGKDAAYLRAKAPKKLKPETAADVVCSAIHRLSDNCHDDRPAWLTEDLIKQFIAVTNEYNRLVEPFNKKRHDSQREWQVAQMKNQYDSGLAQIPLALHGSIKTFDDYMRLIGNNQMYHGEYRTNERCTVWTYVIPFNVIGTYVSRCVFTRTDRGGCRTFRPRPNEYVSDHYLDLTHLWVKVYSDPTDTTIVSVEAGFDDPKKEV